MDFDAYNSMNFFANRPVAEPLASAISPQADIKELLGMDNLIIDAVMSYSGGNPK